MITMVRASGRPGEVAAWLDPYMAGQTRSLEGRGGPAR
jgi:hypothetical protein